MGAIIGSIVFGWISDRLSNRVYMFFPLLVGVLPILFTFNLGDSDTMWLFFVIIPLIGMAIGGATNLISSAVAADLGDYQDEELDARTTVVGIIDGSGGIGAGIGQIIIGGLQEYSWDSVFYFICIINVCAIVGLIPVLINARRTPAMRDVGEIQMKE